MTDKIRKAFVVDIFDEQMTTDKMEIRIQEIEELVHTYDGIVIIERVQRRSKPDYNTFIGSWKLDEIILEMKEHKADLLIFGQILKPLQIYNVNEKLKKIDAQWRDRVDLILKIFWRHAKTTEAKLQIELAAVKHMWPRIFWMGLELSRQWWWIGTSGIGETNTERMRRHLQDKELKIRKKLTEYSKTRTLHREWRVKKSFDTVWIVGYTNAGKSTLLNALTKKWAYAADKLFATLGTSVWKMRVMTDPEKGRGKEILINDTIWFMRDLPPQLVDAFASTLEDSIHSQLLIHLIDASDPHYDEKIDIVDTILDQIWATQQKIYVFNKADMITEKERKTIEKIYADQQPIFISAHEKLGIDELKQIIVEKLG